MLFLAVTLGFFMENTRENFIERKRMEHYASQMYNDLCKDSSDFFTEIRFLKIVIEKLDTLTNFLNGYPKISMPAKDIYRLSAYAFREAGFEPISATMEQLKNSGSLRYIESDELARLFSEYDVDISLIKVHYNNSIYITAEIRKTMAQFLNISQLATVSFSNQNVTISDTTSLKIYSTNPSFFSQYGNWCAIKEKDLKSSVKLLQSSLDDLRKFVIGLKKVYDLK